MAEQEPVRRPIRARQSRWAPVLARWLARLGLQPNQISALSIVFATLAGICLVAGARSGPVLHAALFILAAGFIQLRLLCNLMDGLLAVEGGLQTASGAVFNELPDRLSDSIILACAGYAAGGAWGSALGWCAAVLAVLTAYVRALAGSLGARQDFRGPMAKQQRMEVVSAACIGSALFVTAAWSGRILDAALVLVIAGSALTVARRTLGLVRELQMR